MSKKSHIAYIVEGEDREVKIINNIFQNVFSSEKDELNFITLPTHGNIYMLWQSFIDNDMDIDIISLLKEKFPFIKNKLQNLTIDDFSEVYLFYDYDGQQNNVKQDDDVLPNEVVYKMLKTFDNETGNGKLYISYPMCEALRDFKMETCKTFNGECYFSESINEYKNITAKDNIYSHFGSYDIKVWSEIINCFLARLSCLFDSNTQIVVENAKNISPVDIFNKQIGNKNNMIILSSFPEYIIDYLPIEKTNGLLNKSLSLYSSKCKINP